MRIAHLIWGMKMGGAETMLVDIANVQAETHDVEIFVGNAAYDSAILSQLSPKVRLQLLNRPAASRNPWYWIKLHARLASFSPDVLHAHQESWLRLIAHYTTPKLLTVHDTHISFGTSIRACDLISAVSDAVQVDITHRCPGVPIVTIRNGIRCAAISPKSAYGRRPFRIVQISRLYPEKKGQDILLRAVQRVQRIAGSDSVSVDFIGGGATSAAQKARRSLEALAQELSIGSTCRFLGEWPRTKIYNELSAYDLLVQPSRHEGFGLTVVEAMAAKVPVLVSNIEGPMEVIAHGRHGSYFEVENHMDCADKILAIMKASTKSGFSDQMQATAEYANMHFNVAHTAQAYLQEYQRLLQPCLFRAVI